MSAPTYRASSGVRSYDVAVASAPPQPTRAFSAGDGVSAVFQERVRHAIEWTVPPIPDHVVMTVIGRGQLHATLSGVQGRTEMPRGATAILPVGAASTWAYEPPTCSIVQLHLSRALIGRSAEELSTQGGRVELIPGLAHQDEVLERLAQQAAAEMRDPMVASKLMIESIALAMTVRLLRCYNAWHPSAGQRSGDAADLRMERAKDFIEANLAGAVGLREIAESAGLTPFHFIRAFRRATGRTPIQYVAERRVARAKEFMRISDLTLADIAERCGFGSQASFTTTFRRVEGDTPAAWRRRV